MGTPCLAVHQTGRTIPNRSLAWAHHNGGPPAVLREGFGRQAPTTQGDHPELADTPDDVTSHATVERRIFWQHAHQHLRRAIP